MPNMFTEKILVSVSVRLMLIQFVM